MILDMQNEKAKRIEIPVISSLIKDREALLKAKGLHLFLAYIGWRDNISEHDALPIVCKEFLNCSSEDTDIQDYAWKTKNSGMWNKSYDEFKKSNDNGMYSMYVSEYEMSVIGKSDVDPWKEKLMIAGVFANIIDKEWHCSDEKNNIILNGYTSLAKKCELRITEFRSYYDWLVENCVIATKTVSNADNKYLTRLFTSRYKYKNDLENFTNNFVKQENYEIV